MDSILYSLSVVSTDRDCLMNRTFSFSPQEVATIRSWYEFATEESMRYGGGEVLFPSEIMLLNKIRRSQNNEQNFTLSELGLIADWMRKTIGGKYGSAEHLCGFELALYQKINKLLSSATE